MLFASIRADQWKRVALLAASLMMLLATATCLMAQQVTVVEVNGYVTDPSGQAIANAQVKMVDTARGAVHTAMSDATGRYSLPNLPVGIYRLEVTAPGFKSYQQPNIELEVGHNITVNAAMQIGAVTESVEVSASAAML